MKIKVISYLKENGLNAFLSFLLPILILGGMYAYIGIYPGSAGTLLASDSFSQYSVFHASFRSMLTSGDSIFYTWYGSMGLNYWALIAYYLGGLFTPLVLFFDPVAMPDALYLLTLLKIGCMGLSFWVFSRNTFKLPNWSSLILSISYALMSFAIAFSEILMWLDALIYLPLIILGIHRLMDQKKPALMFISYFLLFVSNFYMAFIVGLYSFLYFIARFATDPKRYLHRMMMYFITSLLAGGASMIMILPTILDIRNNGEALSTIKQLKTAATGPFDLIIKNMVGVYDGTKYGTIPYVYVGLAALVFCLFYFITKKIPLRQKICYGALLAIIAISFYFEPLNLFWQGLHAPNMFLFRFSYVFSFTVLLLACHGLEVFKKEDVEQLTTVLLLLFGAFILTNLFAKGEKYDYLTGWSFIWSIGFLVAYLLLFFWFKRTKQILLFSILLIVAVSIELTLNTYELIQGIGHEWNYPSKIYYTEPYKQISPLVKQTKSGNDNFYRLENVDKTTANDSFLYGYSGISMFSSIRNRHSSQYLSALGFKSAGTNLNIRYDNNTLLMDAIMGIKYNISKEPLSKFGFKQIDTSKEYALYENQYAMPLGILTDEAIYEKDAVLSQTALFNHLSETSEEYFSFEKVEEASVKNLTKQAGVIETNQIETVTYSPKKKTEPLEVTWKLKVPAHQQAYLSILPVDFPRGADPQVTVKVGKEVRSYSLNLTGQYYPLGNYEKETELTFTMEIKHLVGEEEEKKPSITLIKPDVALLDTVKFQQAMENMKEKGVDFQTTGRRAEAEVDLSQDQVLFTTIPYDKGWTAYIDGEKTEIPTFKEAFLTLPVPAGKHTIEFVFLPQGFIIGAISCVVCITGFGFYVFILRRKAADPFYQQK